MGRVKDAMLEMEAFGIDPLARDAWARYAAAKQNLPYARDFTDKTAFEYAWLNEAPVGREEI